MPRPDRPPNNESELNEVEVIEAEPPATRSGAATAERLLAVFLRTLSSRQTAKTYNTEIRMFLDFVRNVRDAGTNNNGDTGLESLTIEELSLYRERLMGKYAPATAAKKLAVMRQFLTFTYMGGATTINPEAIKYFAKSPKVQQDSSYNVLTHKELSRVLEEARKSNYRDYVMLAVLGRCGLREAEIVSVRIGDFQEFDEGQVFLRVTGKGDKHRNVPLAPDLWELVQRYVLLSGRSFASHADARKPIFTSREGRDRPLTTRSIRYIVKKYVKAAGIAKAISPHSIRHTAGTNMAVNEAPLLVIQQFLGHSDPKTTMRYIRRAEELANQAYTYNTLPL